MFGWDIMCLHFENRLTSFFFGKLCHRLLTKIFSEHFTCLPAWESLKLATEASSSLSNLRNSVSLAAQKKRSTTGIRRKPWLSSTFEIHSTYLPSRDVWCRGIPNLPGASSSNLHADVHVIHHIRRFESVSKIAIFTRKTVTTFRCRTATWFIEYVLGCSDMMWYFHLFTVCIL